MTSNPVSLGPSRDAAAVMVLTAGVVGLLAAGWQFFQGLEARSVSLTIFAAGIAAISAMTLGRWLFQIVSRETITIGDGVLALNVAIGPWKRDRVFSLNDVARPRIELRRYRGKFGRSSLRRIAFEYRGVTCRNARYLAELEAERVIRYLAEQLPGYVA